MQVSHTDDAAERKIEQFPYRGVPLPVTDVSVRWLSQAGPKDSPEYGVRLFRVGPGGEIPIHNHFYTQTMVILEGNLIVRSFDAETDAVVQERAVGPRDVVFIPTMEPHAAINSSSENACTFLCAIANVREKDG